jgi:hypothetical protein
MGRLYALLFVVQVILAVVALIGCLAAEADDIRALPRMAWVMIILFFPLIGSIAWFLAGRPVVSGGATAGRPPPGAAFRPRKRPRPAAPDDDPDFLRSISAAQAKRDREMFDRWEEDLRRREEDLRRRDDADQRHGVTDHSGNRSPAPEPTADGSADRDRREGREEQRPEP